MRRLILVLSLLLIAAAPTIAGHYEQRCNGTSCSLVYVPDYNWRPLAGDPDRDYLYDGDTQVGGWCYKECVYRPYDAAAKTWGKKFDAPPASAPHVPGRVMQSPIVGDPPMPLTDPKNQGVDLSQLNGAHEEYTHCGKKVSRREAFAALAGDETLLDDSGKPWLVVIGDPAERKPVADAWGSELLSGVRSQFRIWFCSRDAWSVDPSLKFTLSGKPTIAWEAPDGKELYRQDRFAGPEQLLQVSQAALRKADPAFDPTKTPDPLAMPPVIPIPIPIPDPNINPNAPLDWRNYIGYLVASGVTLLLTYGPTLWRFVWNQLPANSKLREVTPDEVDALRKELQDLKSRAPTVPSKPNPLNI